MRHFLAVFAMLAFGTSATAATLDHFELPWFNSDSEETVYKSADHPGAVFVLELYTSSCGTCQYNAPFVNKLADLFVEDDLVQVLALGLDRRPVDFHRWIFRHQPNHPIVQSRRVINNRLGLRGTPSTYVLDCNLNLVWSHTGALSDQRIERIEQVVVQTQAQQTCELD